MIYVTKKCPNCGKYIQVMKPEHKSYGSPVNKCGNCGKLYIDKEYREIAVEGLYYSDKHLFGGTLTFWSIIWTFCLFVGCTDYFLYDPIMFIIGISMLIIPIIIKYIYLKRNKKLFEEETLKSEERLQNRDYALLLNNSGYKVPEKYLFINEYNIYTKDIKNNNTEETFIQGYTEHADGHIEYNNENSSKTKINNYINQHEIKSNDNSKHFFITVIVVLSILLIVAITYISYQNTEMKNLQEHIEKENIKTEYKSNDNTITYKNVVYVTDLNQYFHTKNCINLIPITGNIYEIEKVSALHNGYEACPDCNP